MATTLYHGWPPPSTMATTSPPCTLATIEINENFDPEKAARGLRKAMRGSIGTDSRRIIQTLVTHQNLQRAEIKQNYKESYGRDLEDDLKEELGGTFEEAVLALMTSPYDLLTSGLHNALNKMNVDEKSVIDILCCRDPDEIESLREHYERRYDKQLDDVLSDKLSGDFKQLMTSLVAAGRNENQTVDDVQARNDAQILYDSGVGKTDGTEEEEFIRIMNNRSFPQLSKIFEEYENLSGKPIDDAIESEFSGDMKNGLLAIVERVKDPLLFYARRLKDTMQGAGTDDQTLIRILVSRSEIDLADIKERYNKEFDQDLAEDIKDDTQGAYQKLLLAIVDPSPYIS